MTTEQTEEVELARNYNASLAPDTKRGAGWHSFKLNGWFVWLNDQWIAARFKNREFTGHTLFNSLEDALKFCANNV